ncbi:hypothetical protein GOZ89_25480, partial [Agrobacterium vitis]|nr:hypothetical protein [Agrobacterium vitis]
PITRTCFALCNPGQRRAIQVLIVNTGVNIGRRYGVNFPRRLTKRLDQLTDTEISAKLPVHLRYLPDAIAA